MSGTQRQSTRLAKIMAFTPPVPKSASEKDDERRFARRKSSRTPGLVWAEGATTNHSCVVKDTSSTGALLEMTRTKMNPDCAASVVPDQFTLVIAIEKVCIDCRVAWRRDTEVGVRYMSPARPLPEPKRRR